MSEPLSTNLQDFLPQAQVTGLEIYNGPEVTRLPEILEHIEEDGPALSEREQEIAAAAVWYVFSRLASANGFQVMFTGHSTGEHAERYVSLQEQINTQTPVLKNEE